MVLEGKDFDHEMISFWIEDLEKKGEFGFIFKKLPQNDIIEVEIDKSI